MVEAPDPARRVLHALRTLQPQPPVGRQGGGHVVGQRLEQFPERRRVLDGERRALRQKGQDGMGGIADQSNAPSRHLPRRQIVQGPDLPVRYSGEKLAQRSRRIGEPGEEGAGSPAFDQPSRGSRASITATTFTARPASTG